MTAHPLEARLAEIAALPADWDSYGARPISPVAIAETRRLLAAMCGDGLPTAIVPLCKGGVQLEWVAGGPGGPGGPGWASGCEVEVVVEIAADGRLVGVSVCR